MHSVAAKLLTMPWDAIGVMVAISTAIATLNHFFTRLMVQNAIQAAQLEIFKTTATAEDVRRLMTSVASLPNGDDFRALTARLDSFETHARTRLHDLGDSQQAALLKLAVLEERSRGTEHLVEKP